MSYSKDALACKSITSTTTWEFGFNFLYFRQPLGSKTKQEQAELHGKLFQEVLHVDFIKGNLIKWFDSYNKLKQWASAVKQI